MPMAVGDSRKPTFSVRHRESTSSCISIMKCAGGQCNYPERHWFCSCTSNQIACYHRRTILPSWWYIVVIEHITPCVAIFHSASNTTMPKAVTFLSRWRSMPVSLLCIPILVCIACITFTTAQVEYQAPLTGTIPLASDHLVATDIDMLTNCIGNDTNPAFTPSPYGGTLQAITPNTSAAFGTPPNGAYPETLRSGIVLFYKNWFACHNCTDGKSFRDNRSWILRLKREVRRVSFLLAIAVEGLAHKYLLIIFLFVITSIEVTLLQRTPSPWTYYPTARGVPRTYRLDFKFHQHPQNSVENDPEQMPRIRFYISLIPEVTLPSNQSGNASAMCADANMIQNCQWVGCFPIAFVNHSASTPAAMDYGSAIDLGDSAAYANTTMWHDIQIDFGVEFACHDCVLAVRLQTHSWTSYWGNGYYFANFTVTSKAVTLPPEVPPVTGSEHPRFIPRVMPSRASAPDTRAGCPHMVDGSVALWNDTATWPGGTFT